MHCGIPAALQQVSRGVCSGGVSAPGVGGCGLLLWPSVVVFCYISAVLVIATAAGFFSIFSTLTTIGLYENNKILFLQRSVELRPQ